MHERDEVVAQALRDERVEQAARGVEDFWARATGTSPSMTRAPAMPRIRVRSCCAQIAPY